MKLRIPRFGRLLFLLRKYGLKRGMDEALGRLAQHGRGLLALGLNGAAARTVRRTFKPFEARLFWRRHAVAQIALEVMRLEAAARSIGTGENEQRVNPRSRSAKLRADTLRAGG